MAQSSASDVLSSVGTEPQLHPLTLSFHDKALETELRRTKFPASLWVTTMALLFELLMHASLNQIVPSIVVLSNIWVPLLLAIIMLRAWLGYMADQYQAHLIFSCAWTAALALGSVLSRVVCSMGMVYMDASVFGLYMTTYASAFFVMQVQYMDFRANVVGGASVAVTFLVCGFFDNAEFSSLGHPTEGLIAIGASLVGFFIGREVQKMLRSNFAASQMIKSTQREMERARSRASERRKRDPDLGNGRYLQMGLIGRGAVADVFLARRTSQSMPHPRGGESHGESALCAVKRLKKSESHKLEVRMLEEFTIMQGLSHPFLVELHDAFQSERCFYFVMTYASGGDLGRWIGELEEANAKTVAAEVLLALGYLHGEGILYRDVKPDNTLVCSDGHIMLADFGVSKSFERVGKRCEQRRKSDPSSELSRTHTQVGTVQYMSPELWSGEEYSYEVDFWALGVMLHEMITGHTTGIPIEPEVRCDELSEATGQLVGELLNPAIDQRLGMGDDGLRRIKTHAYFEGMEWTVLLSRSQPGPIRVSKLTVGNDRTTLIDAASFGRPQ